MAEWEDESAEVKHARQRKRIRQNLEEIAVSAAFLAAVFAAKTVSNPRTDGALQALLVAAAIAALCVWFYIYIRRYRGLDEFEKLLELKATSFAGGCVILFVTSWGLMEVLLGAPDFPIVMAAPLFSIVYVSARLRISADYK